MTTFQSTSSVRTSLKAFDKHRALHTMAHYTGILSMHGLSRLALSTGDASHIDRARSELIPFVSGEHVFKCNFPNYHIGGNGTALLLMQGHFPEAESVCREHAEQILRMSPRSSEGILCRPPENCERVWIDTAFAVTPFLLFTGLALDVEEYVEEAFRQIHAPYELLIDRENGLLHQSRGFIGPGKISPDHWSRGNGWGLLALAELVAWLPVGHRLRTASEAMLRDLLNACLKFQDANGLWHQEITEPKSSYVETSGTGLILFALGVAIEKGVLPASARDAFERGLAGYAGYIMPDGSIFHTCAGCLSPGDGSIATYKGVPPVKNDPHAFGPAILAFGQAYRLGVELPEV